MQLPDAFKGFPLIVLNTPKGWICEDVKRFTNKAVSLNLKVGLRDFKLVVMCPAADLQIMCEDIRATEHFNSVIPAYFHIRNARSDDTEMLTQSLFGLAIAFKGKTVARKLIWDDGTDLNVLTVARDDPLNTEDEISLDDEIITSGELYQRLVATFTTTGQWVLDACCGTDNGVVAILKSGRNCAGVDWDDGKIKMARVRMARCLAIAKRPEEEKEIEIEI
ncbi:uncharacterized protein [Apostichopus japonicus]|uniref:uncharacterized protein n=1 Tax=Stichopus japonicus TaxID=307972 RepID=UPI003AB111CE